MSARGKALKRGCSSMVERELPKLNTRVRFPSPAFARSFLTGYSAAQPATRQERFGNSNPKGESVAPKSGLWPDEGGPRAMHYVYKLQSHLLPNATTFPVARSFLTGYSAARPATRQEHFAQSNPKGESALCTMFTSSNRIYSRTQLHSPPPARSSRATARRGPQLAKNISPSQTQRAKARYALCLQARIASTPERNYTPRRPLVPRGLQRGAARNSPRTFRRLKPKGRKRAMHYIYILESISTPGHYYIGYTANLRDRIQKHQADVSSHAAKFRPWKLKLYIAFESKDSALAFERYLKSGSGRAFCKRHFA
jgi:putative endonuclease